MTEPMHQTRTPPLVERVQLVGGPLDGEFAYVVPGAPYTVERAVLPPRRSDNFWDMYGQPKKEEWQTSKRTKKPDEKDLPPDLREKYKDHFDNPDGYEEGL